MDYRLQMGSRNAPIGGDLSGQACSAAVRGDIQAAVEGRFGREAWFEQMRRVGRGRAERSGRETDGFCHWNRNYQDDFIHLVIAPATVVADVSETVAEATREWFRQHRIALSGKGEELVP